MADETCATTVRSGDVWHSRSAACGRPAKGQLANGDPACGIHLRVEKRQGDRDEARKEFTRRKKAVNEALGIRCFGWDLDKPVTVDLADLEQLARVLYQNTGDKQ